VSNTDPNRLSNAPDAKAMARILRAELRARHQVELTHSMCLELVARQYGLADWNTLAARMTHPTEPTVPVPVQSIPWGAANTTIPVLRIFSVDAAVQFYVDFLGFRLDFGGPSGGDDTAYYGQVTRAGTTLQLSEVDYDPGPGATVLVWLDGLEALREELNARREHVRVWGPAVWAREIEDAPWGARVLTIADPFGNHLHFNQPNDPRASEQLPSWGAAAGSA
jgi:catechol 2,3-dioxygenase-like lactoylglutathione lyase family enzyme